MKKNLDWLESEARANAAFHIASADALCKESNTLLNILLGGAGGSLAYMANLSAKAAANWQIFGFGSTSVFLFIVAGLTVWKCLRVRPIMPPANEPIHLMRDGFDADAIRYSELKNKQACIDLNRARNDDVGFWLNLCRGLAACTPIIFALAAWAAGGYLACIDRAG